jgi:oxalate decarboxylase
MTVIETGARARPMDFEAGDVGYVQQTLAHYIENTGTEDLRFLEMFKAALKICHSQNGCRTLRRNW